MYCYKRFIILFKVFEIYLYKQIVRKYVLIFLNYNREDLFVKIAKDKALLAIVIIRLLQDKKILKKINTKTKQKT